MADMSNGDMQAGCQNKPTVFLFDETQIVQETFLEDINNILTSGTNPCLSAQLIVANPVPPVNLSAPDMLHQERSRLHKAPTDMQYPCGLTFVLRQRYLVSEGRTHAVWW